MSKIRINSLNNKTKRLRAFKRTEWKLIHPEHYGVEHDDEYWEPKQLILQAVDGKEIVGILEGLLVAGVLYIIEFIVKHDRRGMGIGKTLVDSAESWAKEHNAHEICLKTGTVWKANEFYKKHGFIHAANLPNHYSKTDFVLLRKFIDNNP